MLQDSATGEFYHVGGPVTFHRVRWKQCVFKVNFNLIRNANTLLPAAINLIDSSNDHGYFDMLISPLGNMQIR